MKYALTPITDLTLTKDLAGLRHIQANCPMCGKAAQCMSGVLSTGGNVACPMDMQSLWRRSRMGGEPDRFSRLALKLECPECGLAAQLMSQEIAQRDCNHLQGDFERYALSEIRKSIPEIKLIEEKK